jgi:hypothetical protein
VTACSGFMDGDRDERTVAAMLLHPACSQEKLELGTIK